VEAGLAVRAVAVVARVLAASVALAAMRQARAAATRTQAKQMLLLRMSPAIDQDKTLLPIAARATQARTLQRPSNARPPAPRRSCAFRGNALAQTAKLCAGRSASI
jgi:hypothetical protein